MKELVAELEPKPDAPSRIRKLPEPSAWTGVLASSPTRQQPEAMWPLELRTHRLAEPPPPPRAAAATAPAAVEPLSPARHRVQFTASTQLRDKLERLQALMRSSIPDGDLAAGIEVAVTEKLATLEERVASPGR